MTKIEASSPKNNVKLMQNNTNITNNLKLDVNIKNLKKDIFFIILSHFFVLLIFSIIIVPIIYQVKNEQNTIQRDRILEEEAHRHYIREKIKNLELRVNNIMSRLKYNNQIIYSARLWSIHSINDSFILKPIKLKVKNDQNFNSALVIFDKDNSTVTSTSVQPLDHQDNALENNSRILDDINQITSEIAESKMKDLSRKKRDTLKIKAQNHMTTDDKKNGNNTVDSVRRESQVKKLQRGVEDTGRDKKRRSNRRKSKCSSPSRRQLDPAVVTFIGAIPDYKNTKFIGPWMKSDRNNGAYDFTDFHLSELDYSIQPSTSGLYMISVQIFYFAKSKTSNSYWMVLKSKGASIKQELITCAIDTVPESEVSCYTSITTYLREDDRLYIEQQENNRIINLREGHSQVQLVLLASDKCGRRSNKIYAF